MKNLMQKSKNNIAKLLVNIFNIMPIKKNKIYIFSYYGNQYGCSPKYISEYLVNNYPEKKFDIVWQFNDIKASRNIEGIRTVKTMSLKQLYEMCTSKVIITNYRTTELFKKRKDQYYIQTWHSSLRLKKIEKDAEESLPKNYLKMAKEDSTKCDLLLSGCKFSTEIFKRAFWYDGEIFESGTPRSDMLLKNNVEIQNKVKKSLGIDCNKKIILYAPTFRKGDSLDSYNVDYQRILKALKSKFGGDWVFLVRLHPHLVSRSKELVYGENVLDATSYDDIQELLSTSDVLISDYSSLMFDFALTERPCFLYVPDLEEYIKNDRALYFDIKKLPFLHTLDNDELEEGIEKYNKTYYKKRLKDFNKEIGSFEDGKACENLAKRIEKVCFG